MDQHLNTSSSEDDSETLTGLLFHLPIELRIQIYDFGLPHSRHFLNVSSDWAEFKWLNTSRAIFQDAASLVYSETNIYIDLEPHAPTKHRDVDSAFDSHIEATFEKDRDWISDTVRSSLVKKVMIEIWCAFFDDIGDLLFWLVSISTQLSRFSTMEELCIGLRDQCISPKDAAILPFEGSILEEGYRTASRKSAYLREVCRLMRRVRIQLPESCKVRWSIPGETLPEVSFLRENVPEQPPTRKERMITRFMEEVTLFVNLYNPEEAKDLFAE